MYNLNYWNYFFLDAQNGSFRAVSNMVPKGILLQSTTWIRPRVKVPSPTKILVFLLSPSVPALITGKLRGRLRREREKDRRNLLSLYCTGTTTTTSNPISNMNGPSLFWSETEREGGMRPFSWQNCPFSPLFTCIHYAICTVSTVPVCTVGIWGMEGL